MTKETIDYAVTKLNDAFQTIKPDAMELGQGFINYMVMKQTISGVFFLILFIIAIPFFVKGIRKLLRDISDDKGFVYVIFGIIGTFFGIIGVLKEGYDAILANLYPLMWTIEQLAGK